LFFSMSLFAQNLEDEVEFLYMKAKYLYDTDRHEDAVNAFNKVIQKDANHQDALVLRGASKFSLAAYQGAINDFNKSIEERGVTKDVVGWIALAHYKMNNMDLALNTLETALLVDPKNRMLWNLQGDIAQDNDERLKACDSWEKAAALGDTKAERKLEQNCGGSSKSKRDRISKTDSKKDNFNQEDPNKSKKDDGIFDDDEVISLGDREEDVILKAKTQEITKSLEKANFGRVKASHGIKFDASNPTVTTDFIYLSWQNIAYKSIVDLGGALMRTSLDVKKLVDQLEMVIGYAEQEVTVYGDAAACKVFTYEFDNKVYLEDNESGGQKTNISIQEANELVNWLRNFTKNDRDKSDDTPVREEMDEETEDQIEEEEVLSLGDKEEEEDTTEEKPDRDPNEKAIIEIDEIIALEIYGEHLGSRKILDQPNILIIAEEDGIVAVNICVGSKGRVKTAEYNDDLSTIKTQSLISFAIRKAREFWFAKDRNKEACGVILYKIAGS
ncbi:MAG: tetratricopeptide repeat protein, partial [Saprospiraceae bacterium]|nr:tetratricopeptide repeat protein [Saprospiraceae bacterium]